MFPRAHIPIHPGKYASQQHYYFFFFFLVTPKSYLCLEGWKDTCSRKHKSWEGGTTVRETAKVSQAEEDTEAKSPSHTPAEL